MKNYRPLSVDKIVEMASELPEYTIPEIFYSVLAAGRVNTKTELLKLSEEQFYNIINKALTKEKEENGEVN